MWSTGKWKDLVQIAASLLVLNLLIHFDIRPPFFEQNAAQRDGNFPTDDNALQLAFEDALESLQYMYDSQLGKAKVCFDGGREDKLINDKAKRRWPSWWKGDLACKMCGFVQEMVGKSVREENGWKVGIFTFILPIWTNDQMGFSRASTLCAFWLPTLV